MGVASDDRAGDLLPEDGAADPVLVTATRGGWIESRHRASVVIIAAAGTVLARWGEPERPIFPRSANKPLQALPLIESGAADRFGLGATEIALACASHQGEPRHVAALVAWAARIDVAEADLACGAHWPTHAPSARALAAAGGAPSQYHNNCAGKHLGMLTTARHLGEPLAGYTQPDHPVQRRLTATLAEMYGEPISLDRAGVDGCGMPTIMVSLLGLARAMAGVAAPARHPAMRRSALARIAACIAEAPFMLAGSDSFATDLARAAAGRAFVKPGAEGVYAGALPGRGVGFAIKAADGADRAAEVIAATLIERLGVLSEAGGAALGRYVRPPLANRAGLVVGDLRPTIALTSAAIAAPPA